MKENKFWAFNCFYEKLFSCSAKYTPDLIVKKGKANRSFDFRDFHQ